MSRRRGGGFGPAPLSHSDMRNFFTMAGEDPTPWEVEQLEKLDDLWLSTLAEEQEKPDGKRPDET